MFTPSVHEIARRAAHNYQCVTCATHKRPQDVPFGQHAIGCQLRASLLAGMASDLRVDGEQLRAAYGGLGSR